MLSVTSYPRLIFKTDQFIFDRLDLDSLSFSDTVLALARVNVTEDPIFNVEFRSEGVCVGKLRNEVTNEALQPFKVQRMMATDEGTFQGGEDTAPTPLEYFLTGLVGCLMTQIRVFAKKLGVDVSDLEVSCSAKWEAINDPVGPYQARPVGFDINIELNSESPHEKVSELIAASKRACFVEATLAQANDVKHSLRINKGDTVSI